MRTPKKITKHLVVSAIFLCTLFAVRAQDVQKTIAPPERPKFSSSVRNVNVNEIDKVVVESFNLLKDVDNLSVKVQTIKDQLQNASITASAEIVSQIEECSNALLTIGTTSPALAENLADMISNIDKMHVPIMKVPAAIKNLNEARKAIQYAISYTKYLVISVIPNMKKSKQIITDTSGAVIAVSPNKD